MRQTETSDRPSGGIKADLILLGHFCVHVHAMHMTVTAMLSELGVHQVVVNRL